VLPRWNQNLVSSVVDLTRRHLSNKDVATAPLEFLKPVT